MNPDHVTASVLRLILLTDIHKARKAHKPTAAIAAHLRDVSARVAAMEGREA